MNHHSHTLVKLLSKIAVISLSILLAACNVGDGGGNTGDVTPLTNSYTVGGTVSGLTGTGLVLRNNSGDNLAISANGGFTFTTALADGDTYAVTVLTQPSSQACTVTNGSGTVSGANVTTVSVSCATNSYTIGGTVSGLTGTGLVLRNNGGDNLAISANGGFTFTTALASGGAYAVTVMTQPSSPSQTCAVTNGSGAVASTNVTTVSVSCTTNSYTIGGTVSGLSGNVELQNNGGDNLTIAVNGSFTFVPPLASGGTYNVTVLTQPSGQQCSVTGGQGTVSNANVTSVAVVCLSSLSSLVLTTQSLSKVVNLSWSDTGAINYNLYYATAPNCDITQIASCPGGTLDSNVTSPHTVTGLANGQTYYFYLEANHTSGQRAVSNGTGARPDVLVTNGAVSALVTGADGTAYLGGTFTQIGARTGYGVVLDAGNLGSLRGEKSPLVNGMINDIAPDGAGGWYIGGDFTQVDDVARNRLAHILADGTVDPAWDPDANGAVLTLAVDGNIVYAGGHFTSIDGITRNHLAAIGTNGTLQTWNPDANDVVYALDVSGGTVYVGGGFTTIGGTLRNYLAAIGTDGSLDPVWNPNATQPPSASNLVLALAVSGSTVYVGGNFPTIGSTPRNRLAAIGTNGNLLAWDPSASLKSSVTALAVSGSTVYAGGNFTSIGGTARNGLAAIGTDGTLQTWNPNTGIGVSTLAVSGGMVYVGGGTFAGGRLVAIGIDGTLQAESFDAAGPVNAVAVSGTAVYAGGNFNSMNPASRNRLAAIGADSTLRAWNPDAGSHVNALAMSGSTVYVGGNFTTMGGVARNRLAAIGTDGTLQTWNPDANNAVHALVVSGGNVYAGGEFTTIGGTVRSRLAAIGTDVTGSSTLLNWNPAANDRVDALVASGSTVYAGGWFTTIGGVVRNRLAAIGTDGILQTWNPNANNVVHALAVSGGNVYAGGSFTTIGGTTRNYLAAIGTNSIGNSTLLNWNPNANSSVTALTVSGSTVYAGGNFTSIGGTARNYLAAIGTDGTVQAWDPNANARVNALAVSASTVYVGGSFTTIGGDPAGGFAALAP